MAQQTKNPFVLFLEQMSERWLTHDEILDQYIAGLDDLDVALDGLAGQDLDVARPDKWSIRQIVHHIVDGDDVWATCLKAAIGNPGCTFPMDWYHYQEWAQVMDFGGRTIEPALALLRANRHFVAELVRHFPVAWEHSMRITRPEIPDGYEQTVGRIIFIQACHVPWHIEQIQATRELYEV